MDIGEPSGLTRIAHPQTENGRVQFGPVYGIKSGLKRKRQEVCVAVDGDSLNIYEIHVGRNLSSRPIPPDCSFPCSPCTILTKQQANKKQRTSYYVTQRRKQTHLTVFEEQDNGDVQKPFSKNIMLDSTENHVVHLDVLPIDNTHQVLIMTEEGRFKIYGARLSSLIRQGRFHGCAPGARLLAAQWLSILQASKTVLKARPDIIATTDPGCSFVLGIFTTTASSEHVSQSGVECGIWRLPSAESGLSTELLLEPFIHRSFELPSPILSKERNPIIFNSKDTKLMIKTYAKTYVLDLTSTTLQHPKEVMPAIPEQLSSILISDSILLSSTPTTLQLHNTHFRTLQAKLDLNKTGLKRKRSRGSDGPVHFIAYFSSLNRVIAARRDLLIAIDLRVTGSESFSAAIGQSALLVNNIGLGAANSERPKFQDKKSESLVGHSNRSQDQIERWQSILKQLERALQENDLSKFENLALSSIDVNREILSDQPYILINDKLDYLISKIFEFETIPDDLSKASNRKLKTSLEAPRLIEYLALNGLLTTERISKALKANPRSNVEAVRHGDISDSLMCRDDSLELLYKYLLHAPYLAHQELCIAVQLLLRRALQESATTPSLAIAGVQHTNPTETETAIISSAETQTNEMLPANIKRCLCVAIERFTEVEQTRLSKHLRRIFTQREVMALVQFLRQQLFHSGYTRSLQAQLYPSPPSSETGSISESKALTYGASQVTLPAMISTLSICIDAIGPIGVLSSGDEEQFVHTLIPELSSEIAKATEAVQDAAFLEGTLRETLRFIESTTQAQTQVQMHEQEDGESAQRSKPGTIVTLYSESATEGNVATTTRSMPLGLRAEGRITGSKVRKGDGRISKRSAREMGMLQDRLRGPYALERLTL